MVRDWNLVTFFLCLCFLSQFSCGQGGCGACTVNIRPWPKSPTDPPAKLVAANGCLRPLAAVHEMDVSRQSAWKHHLYLVVTVPTVLFMNMGLCGIFFQVLTVEGLGSCTSTHRNLDPIQERIVMYNGSQCG